MKIRTGFVSNSSSSSFIILLDISKNEFLSNMVEAYTYGPFDIGRIVEDINERIQLLKDVRTTDTMVDWLLEANINRAGRLHTLVKQLDEISKVDYGYVTNTTAIELVLKEYYGIGINDDGRILEIVGNTNMFNSLSDMPSVLKDIIVWYTFNNPDVILKTLTKEDE